MGKVGSKKRGISLRRKLFRASIIIAIIGLILVILLPELFDNAIKSQVKLVKDSEIYKNWIKFPVPLKSTFHFFRILNPDDVMNGAKVQLEEVGPFVFEQWRTKEVLSWGQEGETVKYYEYKKYYFKPELSGDWDQEIITVNPIVAGLASNLDDTLKAIPVAPKVFSPFLYSVISGVLISHGHSLFLRTTPRQLLLGHKINIFDTMSSMVEPLSVFGIKKEDLVPVEELPNNAFGILNGKNGTKNGPFEMYTGLRDQSKYGYLLSYKSESKQFKFPDEKCDIIYGTDGAQFPPFRSKRDKLPIFTPDLCRTLWLTYSEETEFKGIPVWKMKLDSKMFQPPQVNPSNKCYCMHWKRRPDRCSVGGTIDLGGCLNGAPLILSAPHFLDTNPPLYEQVSGLKPDRSKHEFSLMFEPRIGSPIYAYGRMQLSVRVEKTSFLRGFNNLRNTFIPFVWIEESAGVDDFLAMILRIILVYIMNGSQTVALLMFILGSLCAIATFTYGIYCSGRNQDSQEHLYPNLSRSKLPHIDSDREEEGEENETNAADEVDDVEDEKKSEKSGRNLRNNLNSLRLEKTKGEKLPSKSSPKRTGQSGEPKSAIVSISNGPRVETTTGIWTPFYKKTRNETRKVLTYLTSSKTSSSSSRKMVTTNHVRSLPFDSSSSAIQSHSNSVTSPLLDNPISNRPISNRSISSHPISSSSNLITPSAPSTSSPIVATISSSTIVSSSRSLSMTTKVTRSDGAPIGKTSDI